MIDEKKIIKKLDNRIDTFVKQHPEEKDCLAVQSVREFKQMIEAEAESEEYCEWKDSGECFGNTKFKIQCENNPLKRGVVPNNFAHHNFKFCPFCGKKIKWEWM